MTFDADTANGEEMLSDSAAEGENMPGDGSGPSEGATCQLHALFKSDLSV